MLPTRIILAAVCAVLCVSPCRSDDSRSRPGMAEFCKHRKDGKLYPDPWDCRAYIYCSGGYAYRALCGKGLYYDNQSQMCDYDIGSCMGNTGKTDAEGSDGFMTAIHTDHAAQKTYPTTRNPPDTEVPQYPEETDQHKEEPVVYSQPEARQSTAATSSLGQHELSSMMPEAMESAMSSLMRQLQRESDMAKTMKGKFRPFKMVQKFLKAAPMSLHLSLPGFVITNASSILMQRLGASSKQKGVAVLQSFGSPLSANHKRLYADEKLPTPEPGTCPWPRYYCDGQSAFRSFSGACNNLVKPILGRSFTPSQRFVPAQYGDGIQSLRKAVDGSDLPNARYVSYTINEEAPVRHHMHSMWVLQWGQFVDHDLTLTAISQIPTDPTGLGETVDIECGEDGCDTPETLGQCVPVMVPEQDPDFKGHLKCLEFVRSQGVPNLKCSMGAREQVNQLTSFLDASNVYGSTLEEVDRLRDFSDSQRGRLKSSPHPSAGKKTLLPTTTDDPDCIELQGPGSKCFFAGDERANEHNTLTVMHTMWMREHNRLEAQMHSLNPHWTGDRLFNEVRKIVGAMVQHITFNEFLPLVLGADVVSKEGLRLQKYEHYMGYDNTVDPRIASGFATAAYRFGHSLLVNKFPRVNEKNEKVGDDDLSTLFFRPSLILDEAKGGIDGYVRGLCSHTHNMVDRFITKQVTNKLFSENPPTALGLDLVTLNIQRGRDHGIPGYNTYRQWCGLRKATNFEDLVDIEDENVKQKFRKLYKHVDDIDLFPAGLSEKPVKGGLVGPTFACIIGRQFSRIRKGDRFWYENPGPAGFNKDQLNEIRKTSLSKVLCTNSDQVNNIQPAVMDLPFRQAYPDPSYPSNSNRLPMDWYTIMWQADMNSLKNCSSLPGLHLNPWKEF